MQIALVTPVSSDSNRGNGVTARRWQGILEDLGHEPTVLQEYAGEDCDLLVALHARRSAPSLQSFRRAHPDRPLILAMTGTDLYGDLGVRPEVLESLELADRVVLLQPAGVTALPEGAQSKARVIYQSVLPPSEMPEKKDGTFQVSVLAHLRGVKDPLRAGAAARLLPVGSKIEVLLMGGVMEQEWEQAAREEERKNPRFRWLGELPQVEARSILARSRAMVLSSTMEGGANVISEAAVCAVPVLASRIPGSVGLLGEDYPGYFAVGDSAGLAALMQRAEEEPDFYQALRDQICRLASRFDPARERESWHRLLDELA